MVYAGCAAAPASRARVLPIATPPPVIASPRPPAVHLEHAQLALGDGRSCVLLRNGAVRCWGAGPTRSPTGDLDRARPYAVPGLDDIVSLSLADVRACAVRSTGQIVCWTGDQPAGASTTPANDDASAAAMVTDANAVSVGPSHVCVVSRSGAVSCWGHSASGAAGPGATDSCRDEEGPGTHACTFRPSPIPGIASARAVAAGGAHTCAVLADSTVTCWGANDAGQLGDGTRVSRPAPAAVPGLRDVVQVALGGRFSCARLASGTVHCWGEPSMARRDGDRSPVDSPVALPDVRDAAWIAARDDVLCWVTTAGHGRCVGPSPWRPPPPGPGRRAPLIRVGVAVVRGPHVADALIEFDGARAVDVARGHACLLSPDDEVRCWGSNEFGAVGDPWSTRRFAPVPVISADGTNTSEEVQRATAQPAPPPAVQPLATTTYSFETLNPSDPLEPSWHPWPGSVPSLIRGAVLREAVTLRACHAASAEGTITLRSVLDGEGGIVSDAQGHRALVVVSSTLPVTEQTCIRDAIARVRWPFARWPATIELPVAFGSHGGH